MFGKIAVIELFLMLAMAGAGVEYFHYTEGVISGLHEDNAKLQVAVSTQQATIDAQQQAAKAQAAQNVVLQQTLDTAETTRRSLEDKLRQKDIAAMARANSSDLERRINSATSKTFNDITRITTPQDRPVPPETSQTTVAPLASSPTTSNAAKPLDYQPPPHPPAQSKGTTP
jgi:hypothetical protein